MFNECRHILTTGYKCKAAALRGQAFCYYHTAARRYARITLTSADPLPIPSIEDTAGVQIALNQVLRQLGAHRMDRAKAGTFFYGLQIAARLARKSDEKPDKTVRSLCDESGTPIDEMSIPPGDVIAPEQTVCEPPHDCVSCTGRESCKYFRLYRPKVEELEAAMAQEQAEKESESQENPRNS